MKTWSWDEIKSTNHTLETICVICKKPANRHGAFDGNCPRRISKFKPYKDMRKK